MCAFLGAPFDELLAPLVRVVPDEAIGQLTLLALQNGYGSLVVGAVLRDRQPLEERLGVADLGVISQL